MFGVGTCDGPAVCWHYTLTPIFFFCLSLFCSVSSSFAFSFSVSVNCPRARRHHVSRARVHEHTL